MAERERPYLRRRDLEDPNSRYYVPVSRLKRNRYMHEGRFPKPKLWIGPRIPLWDPDEVDIFFANLPTDGPQDPPVLWPPQPKAPMPEAMLTGRRPGGKVVIDSVTGRRRYVIPERRLITRPTRRDPPDDPPLSQAAQ